MLKNLLFLLCALMATSFAFAKQEDLLELLPQESLVEAQDELVRVDRLIQATEENLARQKKLKEAISDYRKVEVDCIQNPQNTDLLFQLAKKGLILQDLIRESNLIDYFQPDFIQELNKLSEIASKKTVPPAK